MVLVHWNVLSGAKEKGCKWVLGFSTVDGREVMCGVAEGTVGMEVVEGWLPADVEVVGVVGKLVQGLHVVEVKGDDVRVTRNGRECEVVLTDDDSLYTKSATLLTTEVRAVYEPTSSEHWSLIGSGSTRYVSIDAVPDMPPSVAVASQPVLQASVVSRGSMAPEHQVLKRLSSLFSSPKPTACGMYTSCHFWPSRKYKPPVRDFASFLHPITVTLKVGSDEENLEVREKVHSVFGLPAIPLLRSAQRMRFGEGSPPDPHSVCEGGAVLENVHGKLKLQIKGKEIEEAAVRGLYGYYHYRCDGVKDDGWGCAYRSMQTLISWYVLNGFVSLKVPCIEEIQEVVFKVDSSKKDPRFVGSREWIGSTEIWLALEHLCGVSCSILRLDSGSELVTDAGSQQTLLSHFKHNGTPVMIGGHQYAHTILGIALSETDVSLLILDPHYSARKSSLSTIHRVGWCEWKHPSKVFRRDSWYNICMPQVPSAC